MKSCLIALVLLAVCNLAAATPTRDDALAAIATLETNLLSEAGLEAVRTIAQFAEESEEVVFMLGPETVPWITEERSPDDPNELVYPLLLAVYFAGNGKSQLLAEKAEDDPYSGWVAVLRAYRQLQARQPIVIPSLDKFSDLEAKGLLQAHADEVKAQQKAAEQSADTAARRANSI
jgi:hypothetical protein